MINDDEMTQACTCLVPRPIDEPWLHEYTEGCRAHAVHRQVVAKLTAIGPEARAVQRLLQFHFRHDAPGPLPSANGVCGGCGGTGQIYLGTGADGAVWSDDECGCETPYCGGCHEVWPCSAMQVAAEEFDVVFEERELAAG